MGGRRGRGARGRGGGAPRSLVHLLSTGLIRAFFSCFFQLVKLVIPTPYQKRTFVWNLEKNRQNKKNSQNSAGRREVCGGGEDDSDNKTIVR